MNLTNRQLEKQLEQLDKEDLIAQISQLFTHFDGVKDFYQSAFSRVAEQQQLLAQYKDRITNQFYTSDAAPVVPDESILQKLINDFQNDCRVQRDVIDLILHRVEAAIAFTDKLGYIDEDFYASIENAYSYAISLIDDNELHQKFYDRAINVVSSTKEMGWFFHHTLKNLYSEVYEDFDF